MVKKRKVKPKSKNKQIVKKHNNIILAFPVKGDVDDYIFSCSCSEAKIISER